MLALFLVAALLATTTGRHAETKSNLIFKVSSSHLHGYLVHDGLIQQEHSDAQEEKVEQHHQGTPEDDQQNQSKPEQEGQFLQNPAGPGQELQLEQDQQNQAEPGQEVQLDQDQQNQAGPGQEVKLVQDHQNQAQPGQEVHLEQDQHNQAELGQEVQLEQNQRNQAEPGQEVQLEQDQQNQAEPGQEVHLEQNQKNQAEPEQEELPEQDQDHQVKQENQEEMPEHGQQNQSKLEHEDKPEQNQQGQDELWDQYYSYQTEAPSLVNDTQVNHVAQSQSPPAHPESQESEQDLGPIIHEVFDIGEEIPQINNDEVNSKLPFIPEPVPDELDVNYTDNLGKPSPSDIDSQNKHNVHDVADIVFPEDDNVEKHQPSDTSKEKESSFTSSSFHPNVYSSDNYPQEQTNISNPTLPPETTDEYGVSSSLPSPGAHTLEQNTGFKHPQTADPSGVSVGDMSLLNTGSDHSLPDTHNENGQTFELKKTNNDHTLKHSSIPVYNSMTNNIQFSSIVHITTSPSIDKTTDDELASTVPSYSSETPPSPAHIPLFVIGSKPLKKPAEHEQHAKKPSADLQPSSFDRVQYHHVDPRDPARTKLPLHNPYLLNGVPMGHYGGEAYPQLLPGKVPASRYPPRPPPLVLHQPVLHQPVLHHVEHYLQHSHLHSDPVNDEHDFLVHPLQLPQHHTYILVHDTNGVPMPHLQQVADVVLRVTPEHLPVLLH